MAPLLPRPTKEDRESALKAPGPTWRDYFFGSFLKVYLGLFFFIVDSWIFVGWLVPLDLFGMVPSLVLAVYLEYLAYQYLWYLPAGGVERSTRSESWRRWLHPVKFGRWTEPGKRTRRGLAPYPKADSGPDPTEFF